jgi:hypothetical protein
MAMNGVESEVVVAESQIRSGGRRLTSNGPFIESYYDIGIA